MSGHGSLPRTPGQERRHASGSASRKARSISILLRRESAAKSGRDLSDVDTMNTTDLHQRLMESVLPLFNGEGIQEPIENLNRLVLRLLDHGHDAATDVVRALLGIGMASLREKLVSTTNDKLLGRLSDLWTFFFGSVLPDLQGVLEPMNTPQLLLTPTWNPDQHQDAEALVPVASSHVVRDFILEMYRKEVLVPLLDRIGQCVEGYFLDYPNDRRFVDQYLRIIQLFATMSALNVKDDMQQSLDKILAELKLNHVKIARTTLSTSGPEYTPVQMP